MHMATIVTGGSELIVKNISGVSTTPVAVSLDGACNSVVIKARTDSIILKFFANDEQSEYFTIPAGQSLTLNVTGKSNKNQIGWVATTTGTDVVEIIGIY